jgi:hypothetical protein
MDKPQVIGYYCTSCCPVQQSRPGLRLDLVNEFSTRPEDIDICDGTGSLQSNYIVTIALTEGRGLDLKRNGVFAFSH